MKIASPSVGPRACSWGRGRCPTFLASHPNLPTGLAGGSLQESGGASRIRRKPFQGPPLCSAEQPADVSSSSTFGPRQKDRAHQEGSLGLTPAVFNSPHRLTLRPNTEGSGDGVLQARQADYMNGTVSCSSHLMGDCLFCFFCFVLLFIYLSFFSPIYGYQNLSEN